MVVMSEKPCSFHFPMFHEKRDPDTILDGINQVIEAFYFIANSAENPELDAHFVYPVIVLDGTIFSAKIDEDGKINLTEQDYLQLRVRKGLKDPEKIYVLPTFSITTNTQEIIIDIVKIDYLEDFLNKVIKSHKMIPS
jgi:hypothetical protein